MNGPDAGLCCLVKIELILKNIDGLLTGVTASKTTLDVCGINRLSMRDRSPLSQSAKQKTLGQSNRESTHENEKTLL